MAPTKPREERGEASGSRSSRARSRRRAQAPSRRTTRWVDKSETPSPAPPTRNTRSRVTKSARAKPPSTAPPTRSTPSRVAKSGRSEPPSLPPTKSCRPTKERSPAALSASPAAEEVTNPEPRPPQKSSRPSKEQSKKRKRATMSSTVEEEQEEEAPAVPSASAAAEEASAAISSPIRWPYIPRAVTDVDSCGRDILEPFINIDPKIVFAHEKLKDRYFAKRDRELQLPSLDQNVPSSCLVRPRLLLVRVSATKTVLQISKVVLGLSSYQDGLQLKRSSGFLIDWDADSRIGTILTSAVLIQSKSPSIDEWLARDEYVPHAEVRVHLLDKDDTTVMANLVLYDGHYNIALFKATIDLSSQIAPFSSNVKCAQEVFVLGRDENQNLSINHDNVEYKGPCQFERHHYIIVNCNINKPAIGGPVINFDGEILGMTRDSQTSFIPSLIILKCLDMWKKFNCIPRVHIGMKFSAIIFLDPARIEKISRKCGIDDGLIVKRVSEGSVAEKLGIKAGDIIRYWNRKKISTTVELENFLLCLCEEHLDNGNSIGSNVDLSIDIFHMRKYSNDTIKLTVNVSDNVEIVAQGRYPVTSRDCTPGHDDGEDHGEEVSQELNDEEVGDAKSSPFRKHGRRLICDEDSNN